jgi:hypothetical protein
VDGVRLGFLGFREALVELANVGTYGFGQGYVDGLGGAHDGWRCSERAARDLLAQGLDPRGAACHAVGIPVGIPIILSASEGIRRTGGSFHAHCPRCAQGVKMFEAVKHTNVSAFLAISLWDDEDPVVQCGECLGLFGEDDAASLRTAAFEPPPSKIGAFFSSLLPSRAEPKRVTLDERAIDDELAAMKKRLGK